MKGPRPGVANKSDAKSHISFCVSAKCHVVIHKGNDRTIITINLLLIHILLLN